MKQLLKYLPSFRLCNAQNPVNQLIVTVQVHAPPREPVTVGDPGTSFTPSSLPGTSHGTALQVGAASLFLCLPVCLCVCLYLLNACALLHHLNYGMKHFKPRRLRQFVSMLLQTASQSISGNPKCVCYVSALLKRSVNWYRLCGGTPVHVYPALTFSGSCTGPQTPSQWCSSFRYCTQNTDNCAFHHRNIPPPPPALSSLRHIHTHARTHTHTWMLHFLWTANRRG